MLRTPDNSGDNGVSVAERLVEDAEFGSRHASQWGRWLIVVIAVGWSLFHLALPTLVILNSDYVRAIHLMFAIALAFMSFPALKKRKTGGVMSFLSMRDRLHWVDLALALIACAAAGYYMFDYDGIGARQGMPITRDIIVGILLVALLLEATRRTLGMALPCVALGFIAYAFMAPYLPEILSQRSISLRRLMNQLTMTQEGIYGVPLRVSASTVFLFVLFGAMLERTGAGRYFVQIAFSLLGRFRGGPAKAAVLASGLTGMVSGSSIANVVTTGTFTIPLMTKAGYPPEKAAAIEVAASTNGQLMPPIMGAAAFIIAEYCNLEYLAVVRAAFVPAVVSYLALIYIVHIEALKLGLKGCSRKDLPHLGRTFLSGVHFLAPVAVLVQILLSGASPNLAAFYAILTLVALALIKEQVHAFMRRTSYWEAFVRGIRLLGESLVAGGRGMVGVALACAVAGIIVGIVGMGLGQRITEIVDVLSGGSIILILISTAVASLVLGMGLPTTATYIVMASLTAEVIVHLAHAAGFEVPRIAAHLFCFFFGILADDTPPVGLAAYAGAAIARANPIKTGIQGFVYDLRTAILPFMFVFNSELLLVGIHTWWQMMIVFISATAAMCAFAALTQRYLITKARLHELLLLAVPVILLLQPGLPVALLQKAITPPIALTNVITRFPWATNLTGYIIAPLVFALVYLLQQKRVQAVKQ